MRNLIFSALMGLAICAVPRMGFQDAGAAEEASEPSVSQQITEIKTEYNQAMKAFQTAYGEAESQEAKNAIYDEVYPDAEQYIHRFLEIVKAHPDDLMTMGAVLWIVQNGSRGEAYDEALAFVQSELAERKEMARVATFLIYAQSDAAQELLRAIIDRNPHRPAQAHAKMSLGRYLKRNGSTESAEKLFEEVSAQYTDLKQGKQLLSEAADAELFEIRRLAIGQVAPEIEGEDIDEAPMKLTDYRGKVVVLDFWGHW